MRALILILISMSAVYGCSCTQPPVSAARAYADVVFRGTITAFRHADQESAGTAGTGHDPTKIAVFRVDRVWKGEVGQIFEMPAVEESIGCAGFWPDYLKVGTQLLVYARRSPVNTYFTNICSRTTLAKNSTDFAELGAGQEPKKGGSTQGKNPK